MKFYSIKKKKSPLDFLNFTSICETATKDLSMLIFTNKENYMDKFLLW